MGSMSFSDDMARIQRAVAQCRDLVLRFSQVLEALQLRRGERVLEIGCGGGFLTSEVAQCVGSTGEVRAIDVSADQIAAAQNRCAELSWVTCEVADALSLPYENATFDLVYSHQVFEYVTPLDTALSEVQRVLRLGGDGLEHGRVAFRAPGTDETGHDRVGGPQSNPQSTVHPGCALTPGRSRATPADTAARDQSVLS
jgi:cyclopropane fatty-acyl-phospholipid synthase-like methyltransferase